MQTYETLKAVMNVIERGTHSLRANRHGTSQWTPFWLHEWKIQEDGPWGVLTKEEDATMIA
jgi:hypothetical protein